MSGMVLNICKINHDSNYKLKIYMELNYTQAFVFVKIHLDFGKLVSLW